MASSPASSVARLWSLPMAPFLAQMSKLNSSVAPRSSVSNLLTFEPKMTARTTRLIMWPMQRKRRRPTSIGNHLASASRQVS
ncbi:Cholinesterase, partial [Fusarium oxysporum f. sp. albedinis]